MFSQYLELEKEKSDLYLFMRIFCPNLYSKYVMVGGADASLASKQRLGSSLMSIQAKANTSFMRRVASKLSSLLSPRKARKEGLGPHAGKVIEVYDVVIRTS